MAVRPILAGLLILLGAHIVSAQQITGAPPLSQPTTALSTDQIFIFRGQTPVNSVQIGNLTNGLNDCQATLARGLVPTPPNNSSLFLNGQCQWGSLGGSTVTSLSNTDGTLTIAPNIGVVVASCTTATGSQKGCARPDGSTITVSGGVLTAIGAVASTITVGTTSVASGVSGDLLYDNGGKLGNETLASLLTSPPTIGSVTPSAGTFSTLTATGSFVATNLVTLSDLAVQGTNTVLANVSAGNASPTAIAVSSCSAAGDALNWTTNTGFGCVTGLSTAVGANPSATAGAVAVNGSSANFMRADAAPAVAKASNSVFGIVEVDGTTIGSSSGLISCTTATTAQSGCVKPDGTTITISGGTITAVGAVASSIGVGTTTISSGTPSDLFYDNAGVLGNESFAAACTSATGSVFGCVKADGSTITANSGIISTLQSTSGTTNLLRGATLSQWYGGTSISIGSTITWTAEGIACIETGAALTATRIANPLSNPLSYYALQIAGATGNTDLKCRFVIESYDAAKIAGLSSATFQLPIQNKTGSADTAAITTFYPSTQDGGVTGGGSWSGTNADLTSHNLQTCNNNATCTLSYTFAVNAGANNGYEVVVDFGAIPNGTTLVIGGGYDLRPTPGVSTGLNNSPPLPNIYSVATDAVWDQRFYETSYPNGTAPGNTAAAGSFLLTGAASAAGQNAGSSVHFAVRKRASPTINLYAPVSGIVTGVWDYVASGNVVGTISSTGDGSFSWYAIPNAGTNVVFGVHWTADARIAGG